MDRIADSTRTETAVRPLHDALEGLREDLVREGSEILERWRPRIERQGFLPSALNLAHYIALRRHELRELQLELMPWGLSSLGRCEAHVVESVDAVLATTARLAGSTEPPAWPAPDAYYRGHERLREETELALGPTPPNRQVRIMVTLASQAASDYEFVRELVSRGMDVARINCAHDEADAWESMSKHVRRAAVEVGRECRVCMDISGPRSRTGWVFVPEPDARLRVGDRMLMRFGPPVSPEESPVQFECTLREAAEQVEPGDGVWIDEGKIGAAVEQRTEAGALLRVVHAREKGERLKSDKGLNFPDTDLRLDALTAKDLRDLDVAATSADMVGYSFVQRPDDVELLQRKLADRLDAPERFPIVAKIETALAIRNLPELIIQAAGRQPLAVMIARGDLAAEVGPRRLAEIQEELLWLCEAAHVPVIWATQVLDNFVHKGTHARGEITDAAMAERAECVMLNKGPYAADAVALLDDVLGRMEGHQFKKASRMRALHTW